MINKNVSMLNANRVLKFCGIVFSILVIIAFLDFAFGAVIAGWKSPQ